MVDSRVHSGANRAGIVSKIRLENFMCHSNLEIQLGDFLNFVTGQNGSGKSAILTALCVAFGCRARGTQRASSLKDFIKTGCSYALVHVELKNNGEDAFKPETYGDNIIIERRISESTSSTILKDHQGKRVASRKEDLLDIVEHFNIDVENPCVIMSQDKSREFLHSGNAKDKFKFFFKATLLHHVDDLLKSIEKQLSGAHELVKNLENSISPVLKELGELQGKIKSMEQVEEISQRVQLLKKKLAWAHVYDIDDQIQQEDARIEKLKGRIPYCQDLIERQVVKIEGLVDRLAKKKAQIAILMERTSEVRKMKEELQNKQSEATKERSELEQDCISRVNELKRIMKRAEMLEQQIRDISDQDDKETQAEEHEMEENLSELKKEVEEAVLQFERYKKDEDSLSNSIANAYDDIQKVQSEIEVLSKKDQQIRSSIRDIRLHQTNKVTAFGGDRVTNLLRAIERHHYRFGRPPIGPIGAHLKLVGGDKWAFAVENAVGKLFNAFIVNDHKDNLVLRACAREANYSNLQIIIHNFSRPRLNIPDHMLPQINHPTTLSVLRSENATVMNVLIDVGHAERQVLVSDYNVGKSVAFDRNIQNLKEVYTLEGYKMFSRRSAQTTLPPNRNARTGRLCSSYDDQINSLEKDASRIQEEVQQVKGKKRYLEEAHCNLRDNFQLAKRRRIDAEGILRSKKFALQDAEKSYALESSSRPTSNVDELYQDLSLVRKEIQEKESKLQEVQVSSDEAKIKASELKASFENFCESAKAEILAFEKEEKEMMQIEEDLHSAKAERNRYEVAKNERVIPKIKEAELRKEDLENKRKVNYKKASIICPESEIEALGGHDGSTPEQLSAQLTRLNQRLQHESQKYPESIDDLRMMHDKKERKILRKQQTYKMFRQKLHDSQQFITSGIRAIDPMDTNKRWKFDEEEWKDKFNKAFDEALEKWRLSWTDGSMDHQTTTTKKWGAVRKVHSDSTRHSEFDKEEVNNVEANWKLGYAVKVFDKSPERALEEERDKEEVNDVEAMCQLGYAVKVCDGSPERVFTSTGTQPDFAPPINSHFNGYAKFGKGNDVGGHGEVTTNIWGSYKDGGSGGGPGQGRIRTLALPRFDRTNSDGWKYDQNTGQWYQVDGWDATTSVAGNFDTAVHNEATEVSYLQQTSQSSLGTILQNGSTQSVTNWNQTSHVGEAAALASNCNQVPSSNTEYPSHMYFDPQYPGWYYDTIVQEWRSLDTYIPSTQAAVQSKNHLNQNGFTSIGFSLSHEDKAKSWYSPSGDFASGFTKVQDQILFSIWFDKIPDKPIVWFVNDGTTVPAGSKVQLTADRGLFLSDSKGKGVWRSVISGTASNGVFNDTGNFIIFGSSSTKLWDSFSYQTDTLLPTHLRETNFTKGRFQLRFLENGNLVLNSRDILTNYAYGPYDEDDIPDINASMLKFSTTGYMYIVDRNGSAVNLTENGAVPSAGYYHRAILHFDGILVQYYHPKNITGSTNWTSALHIPKNICLKSLDIQGSGSSGACGFDSVGTLDNSRRVDCECPESYSLVDPNDKYGDCKTNATQNCIGYSQDFYDLTESTDTDWPFSDYAHLNPISEFECRMQCLNDCFCAVAIYREDSCWKKKLPLSNGKKDPSINSKAFLKYSKVDLPPKSRRDNPGAGNIVRYREKEKGTLILVGSVLLGSSVIVNFMLIVVACFGFFYIYNKKTVNLQPANSSVETDVRRFTSHELVEATNGFKEELGRGSFGIIYKGVIQMSSSIVVTVKKIDSLIQDGAKEFKTEVNVIAQTHHKNLVRLVGYCEEEEHHLLVYEYMVNGTLVSFLFSSVKPSWALRKHIALGIARGLAYLHEECSTKIFHCDIKPQNILLGELYNARISDFGPAKLLMLNQSRTNTGIRGTKGYVAPEWFRNTPVTVKVDVYSYGVLLLEINCCRKSVEDPEFGEKAILTDWVWDCFRDGRTVDLVENDNEVEYNLGPDFKSSGYNLKEDVKFLPIYGLYSSNFQKSESEDACNIVRWLWYDLPRRQWRPGEEHDEF